VGTKNAQLRGKECTYSILMKKEKETLKKHKQSAIREGSGKIANFLLMFQKI